MNTLSDYIDPLNWSHRYYLVEAIKIYGFDGPDPWTPIIDYISKCTKALLGMDFNITPEDCHLFYLYTLAEFGDFRSLEDPLTPPPEHIFNEIKRMRISQLRQELLIVNNTIKYNNCILEKHKERIDPPDVRWVRFNTPQEPIVDAPVDHVSPFVKICLDLKEELRDLPSNEGSGRREMNLDIIISRCVSGVVKDPLEFVRDIYHLYTNYCTGTLSEKERNAVEELKRSAIRRVEDLGLLSNNYEWERVREYIQY